MMEPEVAGRLKSVHVATGSAWAEEKRYALDFMLTRLLGIECEWEFVAGQAFHRLEFPGSFSIILRDSFFSLDEKNPILVPGKLPTAPVTIQHRDAGEGELTAFYGTPDILDREDCVEVGPDLVATVFFLLTRWEEGIDGPRDGHGRYPDEFRFGRRHGTEIRPLVNEYAAFISNLCARRRLFADTGRKYSIVPTHDVDRLYLRPFAYMLRGVGRKGGAKRLLVWCAYRLFLVDQTKTFERIVHASDEAGITSHFYWMAGDDDPHDGYYDIGDPPCGDIARHIASHAHANGFHPGYRTYRDREIWFAEKERVEAALGVRATESRQHYLLLAIPGTFRILEQAGIATDSSLGSSRGTGFRCGTGDSFPVYDFARRAALRVEERPLLVMDAGIRKGRDRKKDIADALRIREFCRKYRMPCTILFHNHTLDPLPWNSLASFYFDFIRG